MSLDFGFYDQDDIEVVGFRRHGDLFDFFTNQSTLVVVAENEDYDFYVTEELLLVVISDIEQRMRNEGKPLYPGDSYVLLRFQPTLVSHLS